MVGNKTNKGNITHFQQLHTCDQLLRLKLEKYIF